ncbi:MAG: glucose-6-phosphate dehydrogenase assembly protein OpcA [Simkaniaceae bacterium]|nr:glucose-6-phosphate dehydrogenase assembly protein OpcA [Simkaniaceae bacterium]
MVNTIHPADIETELEKIWDSLQGTNKMRACLFNLIIYAKKSQRLGYLNEMAQKIIQKFPCRIIFVTYDEACFSRELKTAVSVMTADKGDYEIACDLIEVEVCNREHPKVPFVILPHILPDLPIYLVHADDPTFDNPIAQKLEYLAHRIIFDSEVACDLPAYAKAVLSHSERCRADVADLNWARTEGWRQLFASVFKGKECLEDIKQTKKMQMHCTSRDIDSLSHTNVQAIYLQAWLSVQLGWTLKKVAKGLNFQYESECGLIDIELIPGKMHTISSRRILSIKISTNRDVEYNFRRKENYPHHVVIEKSSIELCTLPTNYVLDKDLSGQSLVKEICHKGTSTHYIKVLQLLAKINTECFYNES